MSLAGSSSGGGFSAAFGTKRATEALQPKEDFVLKTSRNHSGNLLASLMKLKCDGDFCDVTIKSKTFVVKAHKVILASATDYFKAMFLNKTTEAKFGIVDFSRMLPVVVKQCIEFIYSGTLKISMRTARGLLDASEMMQLPELSRLCVEFLAERVDMKSCAEVVRLSILYNKGALSESLKEFLKVNFKEFSRSDDFISLEFSALTSSLDLLEKNKESSELQKWNAILTWTNANLESRKCLFPQLFKMLDLHCMSESVIKTNIWTNSLVDESFECMRLIRDAFINNNKGTASASRTNEMSHIVAFNGVTGLISVGDMACFEASTSPFTSKFNFEMDLIYHEGSIYIGTGIKLYQFSNGTWTSKGTDFNKVKRNPYSLTCSSCHQDHWYLGMKNNTYELAHSKSMYDTQSNNSLWNLWIDTGTPNINTSHKCRNCQKVLENKTFNESCYSRCIGIGDSVYMLTMNYVIEYRISTSQIIHHNVVVGLGNGFCIAGSNNRIYALGGNGTKTKAVAFDLLTGNIIQLPSLLRECTFGYSVFKDKKLYATDKDTLYTICYDFEAKRWCDSAVKIPRPPTRVHFGTNLLMNMIRVKALQSGSSFGESAKRPRCSNS